MNIQVRRRIVGPYDNTTYVLVCAGSNESLIVDCPLPNEEAIVEQATGTNVRGILLTHGHPPAAGVSVQQREDSPHSLACLHSCHPLTYLSAA